jgi:hypothetical protein
MQSKHPAGTDDAAEPIRSILKLSPDERATVEFDGEIDADWFDNDTALTVLESDIAVTSSRDGSDTTKLKYTVFLAQHHSGRQLPDDNPADLKITVKRNIIQREWDTLTVALANGTDLFGNPEFKKIDVGISDVAHDDPEWKVRPKSAEDIKRRLATDSAFRADIAGLLVEEW